MVDKIKSYQGELESMYPVKDALFGKQNPSVADKLCLKLDGLFTRFVREISVADVVKDPQSKEVYRNLLLSMLDFAKQMKDYQMYLKHLVENVQTMSNNVSNDNVKTLQLNNPNGGNA